MVCYTHVVKYWLIAPSMSSIPRDRGYFKPLDWEISQRYLKEAKMQENSDPPHDWSKLAYGQIWLAKGCVMTQGSSASEWRQMFMLRFSGAKYFLFKSPTFKLPTILRLVICDINHTIQIPFLHFKTTFNLRLPAYFIRSVLKCRSQCM